MDLHIEKVEKYLKWFFGPSAKVIRMHEIGGALSVSSGERKLKGFGYGKPYLIDFVVEGEERSVVLSSMKPDIFGHNHVSDRAKVLLWQHLAFNKLPKHVRSLDVGCFTDDGELKSTGTAEEYFIIMEKAEGQEYFHDLERIMRDGITGLDEERVIALSSYLAEIHSVRKDAPALYIRRVRELLGHGECIMGLTDSYPEDLDFISWNQLQQIETECVAWRWKLKSRTDRLCQVHGDYHPWNVLFREGTDFSVLDRSRGEWGEAADDLTAMTINYLFFSLQRYGRLEDGFKRLYELFFTDYLRRTGDEEILEVIQPFYVFRGLVVASPIWYPHLEPEVRIKLFNFINNLLKLDKFNPEDVNEYLEA
ncbi:MAG: phosphotransferase family protein [Candidatus Bipolaricaulia bacterium]